jgi:hypothetical protein
LSFVLSASRPSLPVALDAPVSFQPALQPQVAPLLGLLALLLLKGPFSLCRLAVEPCAAFLNLWRIAAGLLRPILDWHGRGEIRLLDLAELHLPRSEHDAADAQADDPYGLDGALLKGRILSSALASLASRWR